MIVAIANPDVAVRFAWRVAPALRQDSSHAATAACPLSPCGRGLGRGDRHPAEIAGAPRRAGATRRCAAMPGRSTRARS